MRLSRIDHESVDIKCKYYMFLLVLMYGIDNWRNKNEHVEHFYDFKD